MSKKAILAALVAATAIVQGAMAQTNIQVFYDFGKDRKHVTTTLEGFYGDKWGNTFFFVDYDYGEKVNNEKVSPRGTYFEIARCLNFWQESKAAPLSIHVEYNGGVYKGYGINHAFLVGTDWFIHSKDFRNTLNLKVLYKYIHYDKPEIGDRPRSDVPLQFTAVWGMQDLFNVKGLRFSGFADFWWEDHTVAPSDGDGNRKWEEAKTSHIVFLTEPQIWYNVGQHFGVDNLNVGTEIELSYDFGTGKGFWCRPCLGLKWVF
ncbi:MAG: DUF5020 family protein [Candidatus Cryptobacteroides sp.]|nr:DUF5020 family protein [Bacteroidales bacterium]MDY3963128.1 DUF5020 family protein [Candidatus Cryptobacteroides sp.]